MFVFLRFPNNEGEKNVVVVAVFADVGTVTSGVCNDNNCVSYKLSDHIYMKNNN